MEEARRIMCDCGKLLCKVQNGEIIVYCVRCKQETAIPISKQFRRITQEMKDRYGCAYCNDRMAQYCPVEECKYRDKLEQYDSFEAFFDTQEYADD